MSRALRIMLVANDGLSAGHVTRTLAIARALREGGLARSVPVQMVLATTSEADALLAREQIALVRMPAPLAGRRAGLTDSERRRLVRGCIEGVASSFGPDVIVVDTFPSGPHGELTGLVTSPRAKMVLVRRDVPPDRATAEELATGLAAYDLAILAADPTPLEAPPLLPNGRCVHVPPIIRGDLLPRSEARAALGIAPDAHAIVITAGGGGDAEALARADRLAASVAAHSHSSVVLHARGPLATGGSAPQNYPGSFRGEQPPGILWAAFDGALAAAGYNTAHELARAGVPAALFASPRSFDDQAGRARRFERAGLAFALESDDDDAIAMALDRIAKAPRPALVTNGADVAADAILDLATGGAA